MTVLACILLYVLIGMALCRFINQNSPPQMRIVEGDYWLFTVLYPVVILKVVYIALKRLLMVK